MHFFFFKIYLNANFCLICELWLYVLMIVANYDLIQEKVGGFFMIMVDFSDGLNKRRKNHPKLLHSHFPITLYCAPSISRSLHRLSHRLELFVWFYVRSWGVVLVVSYTYGYIIDTEEGRMRLGASVLYDCIGSLPRS